MFEKKDIPELVAKGAGEVLKTGIDMAWSGVTEKHDRSPMATHPVAAKLQEAVMVVSGADKIKDEMMEELSNIADTMADSIFK